jgi:hypothetical protein
MQIRQKAKPEIRFRMSDLKELCNQRNSIWKLCEWRRGGKLVEVMYNAKMQIHQAPKVYYRIRMSEGKERNERNILWKSSQVMKEYRGMEATTRQMLIHRESKVDSPIRMSDLKGAGNHRNIVRKSL